jgi:type IV secretory pathway TrbL component
MSSLCSFVLLRMRFALSMLPQSLGVHLRLLLRFAFLFFLFLLQGTPKTLG